MLNKMIPPNSTDLISPLALDQLTTVTGLPPRPAANAANYPQEQMNSRRLRRQTRLARQGSGKVGGWTVRLW